MGQELSEHSYRRPINTVMLNDMSFCVSSALRSASPTLHGYVHWLNTAAKE